MQRNGSDVADGVRLLTNGVSNFYLVEDRGKLVLVDAGSPRDWSLLRQVLDSLGRSLTDLDAVILTHAHSDHTGFAEQARSAASATVWVHADDAVSARTGKAGPTEGSLKTFLLRPNFYRTMLILARGGAARIVPVREVSEFADGEILDVPGRPRAVHAPGHTAGSAALHFESRSALLTGDVLVTRNPFSRRVGPQIMPAATNHDSSQALDSLQNLQAITADVVLAGHGEPWTGGVTEAISRARAAAGGTH